MRLTDREWATAQAVCTPRQVEAIGWYRDGASYRRIGDQMGVDRATAKEHVERGLRRVREAQRRAAA